LAGNIKKLLYWHLVYNPSSIFHNPDKYGIQFFYASAPSSFSFFERHVFHSLPMSTWPAVKSHPQAAKVKTHQEFIWF